jgi:hypothetical protein
MEREHVVLVRSQWSRAERHRRPAGGREHVLVRRQDVWPVILPLQFRTRAVSSTVRVVIPGCANHRMASSAFSPSRIPLVLTSRRCP